MKTESRFRREGRKAFTLIELLVVIVVIAILAGLLFPVMNGIQTQRVLKVATTELNQVRTAIEAYKARKNFYPPDNPTSAFANPLYYELVGTVLSNNAYTTLDGRGSVTVAQVPVIFGVTGFANASTSLRGTDDTPGPESFIKELKSEQIKTNFLSCSEGMRWNYNSSHPTNNPGSYDLWIDLKLKGKTYRVSNWSKTPQVF
jgi:prepilin-type N-terminal cleavage/methylation domain-containing protein